VGELTRTTADGGRAGCIWTLLAIGNPGAISQFRQRELNGVRMSYQIVFRLQKGKASAM